MVTNTSVQVFISYCEHDADWVKKILVPRLRLAGIETHEFIIGRPKVSETEHAIKETKFTLLVISQNYLQNNWKKFESLLAATFSASEDNWNALPILIDRCPLPPSLDRLVALDLSEPTEEKWHQLLRRILEDDYLEEENDPMGGLVETDAISNNLTIQLNDFQVQLQQIHKNIRITRPYLSQIREFSAKIREYLPRLKEVVSEKRPNTWDQFDKISLKHIQDQLQNAETQMAAGIRSKSRTHKGTYLRQVKQSLSSAGESLQYFENVLKSLL